MAYAVTSSDGFLGIGESYHPLPWQTLTYDTSEGGYVVMLSHERLKGAPWYTASKTPDWADASYGRRVSDHYGVPFGGI